MGTMSVPSTRLVKPSPGPSATSPTTVRLWNWKKVSTACFTSVTCHGLAKFRIPTSYSRRATQSNARFCLSMKNVDESHSA